MNFACVGDGTIKSRVIANDPTNFYLFGLKSQKYSKITLLKIDILSPKSAS